MSLRRRALVVAWLVLACATPAWAAFPVIEATDTDNLAAADPQTVNLPAGVANGDLVLLFCNTTADVSHAVTGWTNLFSTANGTTSRLSGWFIRATGAMATVEVDLGASNSLDCHTYRISGHHASTNPEAGTAATGTSANPDPPSLSPSWGSEDTLWIVVNGHDADATVSDWPDNYASPGLVDGSVASTDRDLAASSDDPNTFTVSVSDQWVVNTIAIRPVAGAVAAVPSLPLLGVQ